MIDDLPLRRLAAEQHGLVSVGQAIDLGFTPRQRYDLTHSARWERLTPRVLRLIGAPHSAQQRAELTVLDSGSGAALCGQSAGAWWGIPGLALEPLQVARDRGRAGRPGRSDVRHDPCLLPEHHVRVLDGVRVVTPARALFDIAGTQRRGAELPWWVDRMARLTDTAWSLRLVSGSTLHDMLDDLAQRGRSGIRTMRQVLADRPLAYRPPASGLEARFEQILHRAGMPPLRRQVHTGDEAGWIGRVDFRDPRLPLIVEVQSERFHTSLTDRASDRDRIRRLQAAGFEVVEVTDQEVWLRSDSVIRRVLDARRDAARRGASALDRQPRCRTRRRSVQQPAKFFDELRWLEGQRERRATARSTISAMIRVSSKSFGV